MKRWIMILAAALCLVVLLFGCGSQNPAADRPAAAAQDGSRLASETTQVENIVPDQKTPVEVPAQELTEAEPAEEAPAAETTEPEEKASAAEEAAAPEEAPAEAVAEAAEELAVTEAVDAAEEIVVAAAAEVAEEAAAPEEAPAEEAAEAAEEIAVAEAVDTAEEVVVAAVAEVAEETAAAEAAAEEAPAEEAAEAAEEVPDAEEAEPAEDAEPAEEAEPVIDPASTEFMRMTGLYEVEESLEAGETIVGITYTEGLGESADWFYTTDPWEIQDLWTALQMIETDGVSHWFATDWYPSVEIYLSDLSVYRVAFNGHWLDMPENNYQLKNDEMFWTLTDLLKNSYKEAAQEEDEDFYFVPNSVDLYFPANPTTGYSWTVEVEDEDIIAVEEQYFEDSHALGMAGVGGTQWFRFDGLMEGNTSVKISYQRPWEGNEPLYVFVYRLSVDEWNNVMIWGFEMNPEMD